jgi:flagellar biosynthesis anti-sigma factor FlgM
VENRARPEAGEADKVAPSSDAQLLSTALRAAVDAPEVRQDLVQRMRQATADGTVGADLHRLANRIIDHLLKQP